MEYVNLKNSGLRVSRIGFGCCPMGGYGWGLVSEEELIEAVHTALDNGINFFDTADTYGLGVSETTLGKALGNRRSEAVISTKFGVVAGKGKTYYDNSPAYIRKACIASLERLGTDYIDLYSIHYRDGKTPLAEVVETLDDLRNKGYIRYYGLSNIDAGHQEEVRPYLNRFAAFQNEYSLANRKGEGTVKLYSPYMTPLTWGSLGQGVLTGKYDRNTVFGQNDRRSRDVYVNFKGKLEKNLEIVDVMRPIAARHGVPVSAVAVRFILDYLAGSVALCGIKRPMHVTDNLKSIGWNLSGEELALLDGVSKESIIGGQ